MKTTAALLHRVVVQAAMDSYDDEDDRMTESEHSVQVSHHSDPKDSTLSRKQTGQHSEDNKCSGKNRAQTRTHEQTQDPDKERISDEGDQSCALHYSDDYENASLSDGSFSPRSLSPSPHRGARTRKVPKNTIHPTGVRNGASRRHPLPSQQRSSGLRSQSLGKDAPPKDLDLVTKRLLSARLLKISELKNALAELQLHSDELQRENRLLKQLQLRHEKALHRYSDTESEISQLISRHNNEIHILRERLRRSQEKERMAQRRRTEADAQLQRCRDQLHKLQRLAGDQHLGEREELTRKLTHVQVKVQDSERRVKELEKNMELNTGSFQRQLASERKKTHDALQETQTLREELHKLSAKLKEKERELDTMNIYANRMLKGSLKKDLEDSTRRKGTSGISSKSVQTDNTTLSLNFPCPPLAVSNSSACSCEDQSNGYLSLKEQESSEQKQIKTEEQRIQEMSREQEQESTWRMEMEEQQRPKDRLRERECECEKEKEKLHKQKMNLDLNPKEEKGMKQRDVWERNEEDRRAWLTENEKTKVSELHFSEQEIRAGQKYAEEERQCKDQLLAKMREIDMQVQTQDSDFTHDKIKSTNTPPRNQNNAIFSFTEPHEYLSTPVTGKSGAALRSQKTDQDLDLTFGSYAPSFGKPAPRAGLGRRSPSHTMDQLSADENGAMDFTGVAKEKKSNLMQQLFGSAALSASRETHSKMELLSSSNTKPSSGGRRRDIETPSRMKKATLHVSQSGPTVRAITTHDDDIEEVTL